MPNTYTAILKPDGDWWIGWIEEIPGVNCQEATREELLDSLTVTLKKALEFNRLDTISMAHSHFYQEPILILQHEFLKTKDKLSYDDYCCTNDYRRI